MRNILVKSSALYFAIIIALFIAIITSSLLLLAMHYRSNYLHHLRLDRLIHNLDSGMAFALNSTDTLAIEQKIDLFDNGLDSVRLTRNTWGIYQQVLLKSYIEKDTLKRCLLIGPSVDAGALYLSDENRPLSISGTTKLVGDVYVPKSGLKKAYVNGKSYAYEQLVEDGTVKYSKRHMPEVDSVILKALRKEFTRKVGYLPFTEHLVEQSYFDQTLCFDLPNSGLPATTILRGNIILRSDTVVTIPASAKLDGIQLYAPSIVVEQGFVGNCQLFALDSIVLREKVHLQYPSVAAVLNTKKSGSFLQVVLGKEVRFEGILLLHEQKRSALLPMISLDSAVVLKGEVYSTGLLKLSSNVVINGKVSCNRFLMQTKQVLYENFLIDVTINKKALSKYYLSSPLFNHQLPLNVIQWLK